MRRSFIIVVSCLSLVTLAACGDKKATPNQGDKAQPAAGSMNKMNDGMGSMKQ
jgi:hypothetical protein